MVIVEDNFIDKNISFSSKENLGGGWVFISWVTPPKNHI